MRFRRLVPSDLNADQMDVYNRIVGGDRARGEQQFPLTGIDGALNGPFGVLLYAPQVGGPLQEVGLAIRFRTILTDRAREIAVLQVAAATGSEFEWWAHEKLGRAAGLTDYEMALISEGRCVGVDDYERVCCSLVSDLLESRTVSDEEFERASSVLGRRALVELTVLVGYYRTLAQTMKLFNVGAPEGT